MQLPRSSAKILGLVLRVVGLAIALTTYLQFLETQRDLQKDLHQQADELTANLDAALRYGMIRISSGALDSTVRRVAGIESVHGLYILNTEGKVVHGSSTPINGDEESRQQIVGVKQSGQRVFDVRYSDEGRPYTHSLFPVLAEKICLECHWDTKEGEPTGYIVFDRWADREFERMENRQATLVRSAFIALSLVVLTLLVVVGKLAQPLKRTSQ